MRCGNPAKHTQRLVESSDLIVVGAGGMYEARCRRCFEPGVPKQTSLEFAGSRAKAPRQLDRNSGLVCLDVGKKPLEKFCPLVKRDIATAQCSIPLHTLPCHGGLDFGDTHFRKSQCIQRLLSDIGDFYTANSYQVANDGRSKSLRRVAKELVISAVPHLARKSHHRKNNVLNTRHLPGSRRLHFFVNCVLQGKQRKMHFLGSFE